MDGNTLAKAVLLFFGQSPWTRNEQRQWEELTGMDVATTDALCQLAARMLEEAGK